LTGDLLVKAIGGVVQARLDAGIGFLRIPEMVSPFPVEELLGALSDIPEVRFAVFLATQHDLQQQQVTTEVSETIRWRNDPDVTDSIVIIGDLERDRAAGLASVPTISGADVRRELLDQLIREAQRGAASIKTVKLLQALRADRLAVDLQQLADYAQSLQLSFGRSDLELAVANLWLLKLLPDRVSADVDNRRLRENALRVTELRQSDASTIQRLIWQLGSQDSGDYEALRRFASTGERHYLKNLKFEAVREALRSARGVGEPGPSAGDKSGKAANEQAQFLAAVRAGVIDEAEFMDQFSEEYDDDSHDMISAGGVNLNWDRVPDAQLSPLLEEEGGSVPYAESAGSYEAMPSDEPDPLPGRGQVSWESLREIIDSLRNMEDGLGLDAAPSEKLAEIIGLRAQLERWSPDIPREGIRLFLAAPRVGSTARSLVDAWVEFWTCMEELRQKTDEVGELMQIVRRTALTDTRVVEQGTNVTAYLMPMHPMVLEPRVRAATMFREHPELDEEFFRIVTEAIDPAVPSVKLPVQEINYDLAYSGQFRSLPEYERRAQQFHSPDVVRALQDVIDRFVNVHPYARRSLRVALVDPTAETAKQLLKWLANVDEGRRERVALDVYVQRESHEEVGAKLAEAEEELISAEVVPGRFNFSVEQLGKIDELHAKIQQLDRSPHVLCFFDPAEVTQNVTPIANLTPVLGALVNEWEFGARKHKEATPYIRPRTGSSVLNDFLTAQARLLGIDSLGTSERTPLLPQAVLQMLEQVAADTTWIVVAQGASALVAAPSIGELELLGRTSSGSHTAYIYSTTPALVLEPVLGYLQQHAYLQADVNDLVKFVLDTIRLALPEGLLGFYKRQGTLSDESVLGRLGLAAVVAHLQSASDDPQSLIVSLDTEGARRWLGLREGAARRADLINFTFSDDTCRVEAVEIKTRSGVLSWGANPPEVVQEAAEQVRSIGDLLRQVFSPDESDLLAASRREILKRQVFLEALHQWEPLRQENPVAYRDQVRALNRIFAKGADSLDLQISESIFLVTPGDEGMGTDGIVKRQFEGIEVVQLGLEWFRRLLSSQPGGSISIDPDLLDLISPDVIWEEEPTVGAPIDGSHLEPGTGPVAPPDLPGWSDAPSGTAPKGLVDPVVPAPQASDSGVPPFQDGAPVPQREDGATEQGPEQEHLRDVLTRLQASFRARRIPFISIGGDEAITGPSVVQFPVRLEVGARTSLIDSQADDIARDLGVQAFRIANFPGRPGYALAEVPRREREIPDVSMLSRPDLPYPAVAIGAQLDFNPYWACLDRIPHLLIAGKTGSGKSVLVRSLLWQLTRLYGPDELDLVLIGPKAADYIDFGKAPHFKSPADIHLRPEGALDLLKEIVEVRYPRQNAVFDEYVRDALTDGVRISNLRELMTHATATGRTAPLRPFVVIVDEFVELLDSSPMQRREFETLVARFSRLFRYIGGTMIAATQRPSAKSITGDIKANFRPLALRVERSVDSRVILDENGAEQLIGQGDLLYKSDNGVIRLQGYAALGTYISLAVGWSASNPAYRLNH
jgi:hypothetical protein